MQICCLKKKPLLFSRKLQLSISDGKLSDFLVHAFQVRFDVDLCLNVIFEISFGSDQRELKIYGGDPRANFMLPLLHAGNTVISFEISELRKELNFDWFKFNVLCLGQNWICNVFPVNASNLIV